MLGGLSYEYGVRGVDEFVETLSELLLVKFLKAFGVMLAVVGESLYSLFGSISFGVTAVDESNGVLHGQVV